MSIHEVTVDVGGRTLRIETGRMARLAAGAALIQFGETMVLSATSTAPPRPGLDFFPLTVDYREKTYSAGKIPGGFLKREAMPSPKEILTMRMADRPIRPLWPEGFKNDVQIQSLVISYDQLNDPDVLSIIGAGASVALSPVPFLGPIGAVRVGLVDGEYVAFPDTMQRAVSAMDMVVAGTRQAVTMVEGGMNEVTEEQAIGAIEFAHEIIKRICAAIEQLRRLAGWTPVEWKAPPKNEAVAQAVAAYKGRMKEALFAREKLDRTARKRALVEEARAALVATDEAPEGRFPKAAVDEALSDLEKQIIREAALSGTRVDGRRPDEVRPIQIEVGLLPRAHGSVLFTRGETQALVAATLGTGMDEKLEDGLNAQAFTRKYYLHYNFPPLCVGETRPIRGPSRREVGHGALAERALLPVLPAMEDFPYTLRIVSDVLMSNGSSSMASVCGNTLAMMDAGVKIKRPVAGIAMGLVEDEGQGAVVLSDILGDEDHAGDMDFKVAGTQVGITALQMDIKMTGVSKDLLRRALDQAREGRMHILREMLKAIDRPREEYSRHAPRVEFVQIKPEKIGMLIGPGGKNIRRIQEETGTTVEVDDTGRVKIFSTNAEAALAARKQVEAIAEEATLGKIYDGKVTSIKDFGAFLEIIPGIEGLCHISELADGYVGRVDDVVKMGDIVPVKVILVDDSGRVKLSRKQALIELGQDATAPAPSGDAPPPRGDGDRRPRDGDRRPREGGGRPFRGGGYGRGGGGRDRR